MPVGGKREGSAVKHTGHVTVGAFLQAYSGLPKARTLSVSRTLVPTLTRATQTVPLEANDANRYDPIKLVELGWGQQNPAFLQLFTSQFFPGASLAQMHAFNEIQRHAAPPHAAATIIRAFAELDASEYLAQIRCPALVFHSRGDNRVPFDEGRLIAASIPDARFLPLDTDTCRRKVEYLSSVFGSQRDKHWFTGETFMGLMRLRGMECRAPDGYAEAFYSRKTVLQL